MQSRTDSLKEVFTNTFVGMVGSFLITWGVNEALKDKWPLVYVSALIVLLCTVWSLARGYYIRRLNNAKLKKHGDTPMTRPKVLVTLFQDGAHPHLSVDLSCKPAVGETIITEGNLHWEVLEVQHRTWVMWDFQRVPEGPEIGVKVRPRRVAWGTNAWNR